MRRAVFLIVMIFLGCIHPTAAQEKAADSLTADAAQWDLLARQYPWLQTSNAAAVNQLDRLAYGRTYAGYAYTGGGYHRPQEASTDKQLQFRSERYQPLGKAGFYGLFEYRQDWANNIQWSDVLDPFRGSPYLLADSVGGDWKKQFFHLEAKAATAPLANGKLTPGLGISYQANTGARQNDPRPLSYVNQLDLSPSAIYQINSRQQAGLSGHYGYFKEDIDIELRRNDRIYGIYKLKGLGMHNTPEPTSSGASRGYSGRSWGGEAQYRLEASSGAAFLSSLSYGTYLENTRDGITSPRNGGQYKRQSIQFNNSLQWGQRYLQQFRAALQYEKGTGREYHQEYDNPSSSYQTIFQAIFYRSELRTGTLAYQIYQPYGSRRLHWLAEAKVTYTGLSNDYLLSQPGSQQADLLEYQLSGKWHPGRQWQVSAGAGYRQCLRQSLSSSGGSPEVANGLLYPDHDYLSSQGWQAQAGLRYQFWMPRAKNTAFFIEGLGIFRQRTDQVLYPGYGNSRQYLSFSIGVYY